MEIFWHTGYWAGYRSPRKTFQLIQQPITLLNTGFTLSTKQKIPTSADIITNYHQLQRNSRPFIGVLQVTGLLFSTKPSTAGKFRLTKHLLKILFQIHTNPGSQLITIPEKILPYSQHTAGRFSFLISVPTRQYPLLRRVPVPVLHGNLMEISFPVLMRPKSGS